MDSQAPAVFAVRGPLTRADLPGLYRRVCALLAKAEGPVVICDVTGVAADVVTVEALTRFQLAARRRGQLVRLSGASGELRELVAFMGLREVLRE